MARSLLLLDTVLVLLLHAFCVGGPTRDATMGFYPFTFLTSTPLIQPQMNRIHLTKDYRFSVQYTVSSGCSVLSSRRRSREVNANLICSFILFFPDESRVDRGMLNIGVGSGAHEKYIRSRSP
jgi:hypothetical protein